MANSIGTSDEALRRYITLFVAGALSFLLGFFASVFAGAYLGLRIISFLSQGASDLDWLDAMNASFSFNVVLFPTCYFIALFLCNRGLSSFKKMTWHWISLSLAFIAGISPLPLIYWLSAHYDF